MVGNVSVRLGAYRDLPDDANVEAWLVTIAHNKAIDIIRSRARQAIPVDSVPEPTDVPDPERNSELMHALSRLPEKQRQAVVYHYLAGLPYAEVAHICGGTTDAARRAVAGGVAALRRSFRGDIAAPRNTSEKGAHS